MIFEDEKRVKNNQVQQIIHQYCDNRVDTGVFILDPDNSKPRSFEIFFVSRETSNYRGSTE